MRRLILVGALALLVGSCGDDDGGGDVIDAGPGSDGGGGDDGDGGPDDEVDGGGGGGGTQGPGQFCETLENGGPHCMAELECCDDHVCRYDGDCPGDTQYIPCDCTQECPTGLCCDVGGEMESFCTKRSACNDYEGDEDTMCN